MGADLVVSYILWMISFAIIGGAFGVACREVGFRGFWGFLGMMALIMFVITGTNFHLSTKVEYAKRDAVITTLTYIGATIHPEYISFKDGTTVTLPLNTKLEK
jgi:hypothetical protein